MGDYTFRVGEQRAIACVQAESSRLDRVAKPLGIALLLITVAACGDGEKLSFPTNEKAAGALVSVDNGDTVVGFTRGKIRVTEKTESFKISKHPVTTKQYKDCQKAGVCKEPNLDECSDPGLAKAAMDGEPDNVAICVGKINAETFCKWVGGRLPTLAEWLRAARGPNVQEFPWGDDYAKCSQHPRSVDSKAPSTGRAVDKRSIDGCKLLAIEALATRQHSVGASVYSGMQDVLIAPSELVVGSDTVALSACAGQQNCLVYGVNPGSIDSVKPYATGRSLASSVSDADMRIIPMAYGFRCVVGK